MRVRSRGIPGTLQAAALLMAAACGLSVPTSPNDPAQLTGQNPNEPVSFNGTIVLTASAASIPADGTTDVLITATVRDAAGRPVANLTPVSFATDLGLLRPAGSPPESADTTVTVGTLSGRATVALRSAVAGTATVTASVADVVAALSIILERVPIEGSLSLVFRIGGEDFFNVSGTAARDAPFRVGIVATATSPDGAPLAAVKVRFRIVRDGTVGTGVGRARLEGPPISFTNTAGEAFNQLKVVGVGSVVLQADLVDPNTDDVVATSNQIVATTEPPDEITFSVSLTFSDGTTTTFTSTAPYAEGILATVVDSTGAPQPGRKVRFRIRSDTTTGATLAGTGTVEVSTTNTSGVASNAIRLPDPGRVVIVAELLAAGAVVATSNEIVAIGL